MSIAPGTVFGPFTVVGDAPAKSGHLYTSITCTCGAPPRAVRASWLRKGDITCPSCGARAQSLAPAQAGQDLGLLVEHLAPLTKQLAEMGKQLVILTELVRSLQPQPKAPGLKNHRFELDPTAVTAAGAAARLAALPANAPITKDSLLAGCSSKEEARKALDDNQQRALELAALPFAERTPALKEELRQRMVANAERLHGRLPTDPGYTDIATHNRTLHRAFADWDRDTSKD
jgi:hypothetical protein